MVSDVTHFDWKVLFNHVFPTSNCNSNYKHIYFVI